MLISVVGTTGLGQVAGVPVGRPAALLRVVANRPDRHVIVLAPRHAESAARVQADLVSAARPSARVEIVMSHHHALTLTLVAERSLRAAERTPTTDLVELLALELAAARSLVWCPSVWRLTGAGLDLRQRLRSFVEGPGFVVELGDRPQLHPADGWRPSAGDRLFTADQLPVPLMITQLGAAASLIDTEIDPGAPYAPRAARLLTVLTPETTAAGTTDHPQESEAA